MYRIFLIPSPADGHLGFHFLIFTIVPIAAVNIEEHVIVSNQCLLCVWMHTRFGK